MRKPRQIKNPAIDHTKPAYIVVEKFGGLSRFCELTAFATSTVYDWLIGGHIPGKHHRYIMEMARTHTIEIEPADFVERMVA